MSSFSKEWKAKNHQIIKFMKKITSNKFVLRSLQLDPTSYLFKTRLSVILVFFFLGFFSANSATIFVNSATGSDLNTGTSSASPYKTFHKAYTMAASGDVINLTGTFDWTAGDEIGDANGNGYSLSKAITIIGQSANTTFIQAAPASNTADRRVFTFNANVSIQNLTIRNGKNSSQGGGLYASSRTLDFINVAIENNYGDGGGAAFFSVCTLTFTNCTFEGNNSTSYAAVLYAQQSKTTLTNCTMANNTASGNTIFQVENYNMSGYELNLTNVTVAFNTVLTTSDYHGHIYQQGTQIVRLKNCLFAKNLSPNTATKHDYLNYSSTAYTVAENNLIENDYNWAGYGLTNGVNNNIIGNQASAILLNTLALNSSSNGTKTLALIAGSPAINSGSSTSNGIVTIPTTDQRGVARSGNTDIGSYEYVPAIREWVGTTSTVSTVTSNWTNSIVPVAGENVSISASAVNDLVLTSNLTFGDLTFNGAIRKVDLGNYTLTATTINGANATNYVKTSGTGKLIMTLANNASKVFPIGNVAYNPLTITNKSGSSDVFSARVLVGAFMEGLTGAAITSTVLNRTWDISKTNANAGSGVDIVFNWNAGEVVNGSFVTPKMNHYSSTTSNWEVPTVATSVFGSNMLTVTGYTGTFSPFTVAEGPTALPVEMVYFLANCSEADVQIQWQTASEHNSDYFQLETSLDAVNWEMIQTIPAAGFSQELINYIAVDKDALRNQKYYRLKQVDFNGDFEIYGPLKADCAVESTNIGLHPNPCATEVMLSIASQIPTEVNYTLISPEGKVLENKQMAVQSGITLFTLDVSNYPSGMYMLQFDVNDKRFIKKLTVQ